MTSYLAGLVARHVVNQNMIARGADPNVQRPIVNLFFILPTFLCCSYYGAQFGIESYIYCHNSRAHEGDRLMVTVDDMPQAAVPLVALPCVFLALMLGLYAMNELMYAIPYVRRVNEEYILKANAGGGYLETRAFMLRALRIGPLALIPIFLCAVLFL